MKQRQTSQLQLPPLGLYVHIPWCIKKCPYCDFNSHTHTGELPEQSYVDALLEDLRNEIGYIQERSLSSIFIGGGTPSLFSANAYERLLKGIEALIPFDTNIEITLEANPGTMEQQRFKDYRLLGINRLSIGIQSFAETKLKALGRIHDHHEALSASHIAQQAGFDNFNLDLMFGLPDQTSLDALNDLKTAISMNPSHLSWYQLTLEPNTVFNRFPPELPNDDYIADMQETGQALLASHGFQQYETSAYAREDKLCRHNVNYWQFGDYLGIGAGAHGKITIPTAAQKILRTRKSRQPDHYLHNSQERLSEVSPINQEELALEFMMNAMRLSRGANSRLFEARTGLPFDSLSTTMHNLQIKGLLSIEGDNHPAHTVSAEHPECLDFKPTARGRLFLNEVLQEFMP